MDIFVKSPDMESKRQRQISELIKRNFSIVLMQDGLYIYGDALVSVTNVVMSPDLRLAKIYVSIFNSDNKEEVLDAIRQHLATLKQNLVARIRKQVRFIPEVAVFNDDLIDEIYNVNELLDNL